MGGRYDGLLRALWTPTASAAVGPPPSGVGLSVNIERLSRMIDQIRVQQPQQQLATIKPSQVCGTSGDGACGMITDKLLTTLRAYNPACHA
jgi:histidyl-tRNA synthetase